SELCIELRAEARGEESVAKQAARCIKYENLELGLGNRESVWPSALGQKADDKVKILDVVHQSAVGMPETVIYRLACAIKLGTSDYLRRIAAMLPINLSNGCHEVALFDKFRRVAGQALVD